ncbi:MAG: sulfatase [Planctomycetota bacterium]
MFRSSTQILTALATALLVVTAWQKPVTAQASSDSPNVLFIAVDDLNDWIDPLGGHPLGGRATPNLTRLANMGVNFTNAHASAPSCNPSRSSMLLGLSPQTTGIYFNGSEQHIESAINPSSPNRVTIPSYFRNQGYTTNGAGKIFHNADAHLGDWSDYGNAFDTIAPPPENLNPSSVSNFSFGPYGADVDQNDLRDVKTANYAVNQIQNHSSSNAPLFVGAGIFRPHLPWYAPQEYYDLFPLEEITLPETPAGGAAADLLDIPVIGQVMARNTTNVSVPEPTPNNTTRTNPIHDRIVNEFNQHTEAVQAYLASIAFADAQIGKMLDALEAKDVNGNFVNDMNVDNTIIVAWSDHGMHLGEKEHWRKFTLWEEATQVPFLIAAPGVTTPGSSTDVPVSLLDVFPTLVDLAGLPEVTDNGITSIPGGLEGESLRSLLESPNDSSLGRVVLTYNGEDNIAARDVNFRYIRYSDGGEELYDHRTDPGEFVNSITNPLYYTDRARLRRSLSNVVDAIDGVVLWDPAGELISQAEAPASLRQGQLASIDKVRLIAEQQNLTLDTDLSVNFLVTGDVLLNSGSGLTAGLIAAGEKINSHLIHVDTPSGTETLTLEAEFVFDGDIIGLIFLSDELSASDSLVGLSGVEYPSDQPFRQLILSENQDSIEIEGSVLRITSSVSGNGFDHLRVITRSFETTPIPEPASAATLLLGFALVSRRTARRRPR